MRVCSDLSGTARVCDHALRALRQEESDQNEYSSEELTEDGVPIPKGAWRIGGCRSEVNAPNSKRV